MHPSHTWSTLCYPLERLAKDRKLTCPSAPDTQKITSLIYVHTFKRSSPRLFGGLSIVAGTLVDNLQALPHIMFGLTREPIKVGMRSFRLTHSLSKRREGKSSKQAWIRSMDGIMFDKLGHREKPEGYPNDNALKSKRLVLHQCY